MFCPFGFDFLKLSYEFSVDEEDVRLLDDIDEDANDDGDGDVDVGVGINSIHVCQYDFLVGNVI